MNQHRVLIVGVGSIGERHLRCFGHTGRAQLAICEPNTELRERIAAQYNITDVYPDVDSALQQSFDAAVIAVPAHVHIPIARQLAAAGMHLLIEKPLSTNFDGIAELQRIVEEKKLVPAVGYVYRATSPMTKMRELLHEGIIGRPRHLVCVAGEHFPTHRPAYRNIYYNNRATGGGAIQDSLTHMVNAGEWLLGPVTRLVADAAHQQIADVEVEDTVGLLARHGAVMANYTVCQYMAPAEITFTITGERGTIRLESHRQRVAWMQEPDGTWQEAEIQQLARDDTVVRQANVFLDAVEGRCQPLCTLDEGLQTLRVNLAALTSVDSGEWQSIDPSMGL